MYTKSYHNVEVFTTFKIWYGIVQNWKWFNDENVQWMAIQILIYSYVENFLQKKKIAYQIGIFFVT